MLRVDTAEIGNDSAVRGYLGGRVMTGGSADEGLDFTCEIHRGTVGCSRSAAKAGNTVRLRRESEDT
jgi:hypothetical protein